MAILVFGITLGGCSNRQKDHSSEDAGVKSVDSSENLNDDKFASNASDKQSANWLVEAYNNSLFSVKVSEEVLSRKVHPLTKSIAQRLTKGLEKFNKKTEAVAQQLDVSLPREIGNKQKKRFKELKSRADFENKYLSLMLNLEEKNLRILKDAEKSSNNAIRRWSKENQDHLTSFIDAVTTGQKKIDSLR